MTVGPVQGVCNASVAPPPTLAPSAGGPALLPSSAPPTLGQMQGALADLYLLMSQMRDVQVGEGKVRVNCAKVDRDVQLKEQEEAMRRAKEAAEEGGVFDWLSKDIGLAGCVGLVTFNYALVAADIAAHKTDLVDNVKIDVIDVAAVATGRYDVLAADILLRKTDLAPEEARALLEKAGLPKDVPGISDDDVKPIAKKLLIANLIVASVVATIFSAGTTTGLCIALAGLAISAAGSQVSEHKLLDKVFGEGTSKYIGLGMQIYGAACSGMSGLASGAALSTVASNGVLKGVEFSARTKAVAIAAQGGITALNGTDQMVIAANEEAAADANIDAEEARMKLARLERLLDFLIEGLKESNRSHRKAGEAIQGAISQADQTQLALAQGTRV
jgi:hypothetical protein